jgi:hypothetical protein
MLPNVDSSLNKFVGDNKKKLDRAYIIWCCKSQRPLTMAEKDPHFRTFIHSVSNGRYVPPCKKVCMEELTTLVAASRVTLREHLHEHLDCDGLDLSISGKPCNIMPSAILWLMMISVLDKVLT